MNNNINANSGVLRYIKHFYKEMDGVSAVEFALIAPLMLLMLMGGFEAFQLYRFSIKIERTVSSIGDIASRFPVISEGDVNDIFELASHVDEKQQLEEEDYRVFLVSISNSDAEGLTVNWVRDHGNLDHDSRLVGQTETLVAPELVDNEYESLIASEAIFTYHPVFPGFLFNERLIKRHALFRPRSGRLTTIAP